MDSGAIFAPGHEPIAPRKQEANLTLQVTFWNKSTEDLAAPGHQGHRWEK